MNSFYRFSLALLIGLSFAVSTSAQVTWSSKTLDLAMTPGAAELEGAFTFTNDGEADVTITSIKSSCGCTTAALEQKTYGPGESGEIAVAFNVGDRVGKQVKKIVVRTDDPATPVTTLTLRTTIPKWVELKPRLLMWKADEPLEAKTVEVTFHDVEPVVLTQAETEAAGLSFEVEELEEGRRYLVTVLPGLPGGLGEAGEIRSLVRLKIEDAEAVEDAALIKKRDEMLRFLVRVSARPTASADTNGQDEVAVQVVASP